MKEKGNRTVRFLNHETGRVEDIHESALPADAVMARMEGDDEEVWVLLEHLQPGDVKHGPFSEDVRAVIREIQSAFWEQHPLSLEQWEEGFRRDAHPAAEIALWLHAAETYQAFAAVEEDFDRRREIFRCIVACMTTSPDTVWLQLQPKFLSRSEAERVVDAYYRQQG